MCFPDAYYVPDENEKLMNEPHGYLTNDDVKNLYFFITFSPTTKEMPTMSLNSAIYTVFEKKTLLFFLL